jgi:hypothetical protein
MVLFFVTALCCRLASAQADPGLHDAKRGILKHNLMVQIVFRT